MFNLCKSKKELFVQISIQQKEIEILKRKQGRRRIIFLHSDRIVFSILNRVGHLKDRLTLVKPETVLRWQRQLIKHFWTFKRTKRVGRPPVTNEIKQLVLAMKNDNLFWGYKKIQGELKKLDIHLDKKTIRNILNDFRRKGRIKQSLTWEQFLRLQIHSIYAMDFFTVDTILQQRFYVYFMIYHKSREIVHFAITRNPCRQFVRQQLIDFEQSVNDLVYVIHDNAAQFHLDYLAYGIKEIRTSVEAPNMNAIAERFIGSVRREALDYFLLISEKQVLNILREYIDYYNSKRPHQGLEQNIPQGFEAQKCGKVRKTPILGGLYYHYERRAA
jgi:transposase InsO family protein